MKTFMFALVAATAFAVVAANKPEPKPDPDAAAVFDMRIDAAVRRETARYVKALTAICKKAVKAKRLDKALEIVDQIAVVDKKAAEKVRKTVVKVHAVVGKWTIDRGHYRFRAGGIICGSYKDWSHVVGKWRSAGNAITMTLDSGAFMNLRVEGDVVVGTLTLKGREPQAITGKRHK